ncbi:MAG: nucleoside deaminase [Bacteroidales bacterium]|nr:nucleoside deaminase [Bacteroidales bacterium]
MTDEQYMQMAIREARAAATADEIPVGAIVVAGDRVIGRGRNATEALQDVTAHAEILAITAAAQTRGAKYLDDATLYVTLEPCLMCAGAIGWSQLSRIVIGARDPRRGFSVMTSQSPFHPRAEVVWDVCGDECRQIIVDFFKNKR